MQPRTSEDVTASFCCTLQWGPTTKLWQPFWGKKNCILKNYISNLQAGGRGGAALYILVKFGLSTRIKRKTFFPNDFLTEGKAEKTRFGCFPLSHMWTAALASPDGLLQPRRRERSRKGSRGGHSASRPASSRHCRSSLGNTWTFFPSCSWRWAESLAKG